MNSVSTNGGGVIKEVLFWWIVISTFDSTVTDANFRVDGLMCVTIEVKGKTLFLATFRTCVPGGFAFVGLEVWRFVHSC